MLRASPVPHGRQAVDVSHVRNRLHRENPMTKPIILDGYCGVGGAAEGYYRAFGGAVRIIGVDKYKQPDYPFEFVHMDFLQYMSYGLSRNVILAHTSPPCQDASALTKGTNQGREYPKLIEPTREALDATGIPYVIENVSGAAIRKDVTLCGEMFGLAVIRHRHFELGGWQAWQPEHKEHKGRVSGMRHGVWYEGPYFAVYGDGGGKGSVEQWRQAMGIDWTWNRKSIAEAIPPAYTDYIGREFIRVRRLP